MLEGLICVQTNFTLYLVRDSYNHESLCKVDFSIQCHDNALTIRKNFKQMKTIFENLIRETES